MATHTTDSPTSLGDLDLPEQVAEMVRRFYSDVHKASPPSVAHFRRWLELFEHNLDRGWAGENTEQARTLANNVARVHANQLRVVDTSTSSCAQADMIGAMNTTIPSTTPPGDPCVA